MLSFDSLSRVQVISVLSFLPFDDLMTFSLVNSRYRRIIKNVNWNVIAKIKNQNKLLSCVNEFNFKRFDLSNCKINDFILKFFYSAEYLNLAGNVSITIDGLHHLKCSKLILPNEITVEDLHHDSSDPTTMFMISMITRSLDHVRYNNLIIRNRLNDNKHKKAIFSNCLILINKENTIGNFDNIVFDNCYSDFNFLSNNDIDVTFKNTYIDEVFFSRMNKCKTIRLKSVRSSLYLYTLLKSFRFSFYDDNVIDITNGIVYIGSAQGRFLQ